MKNTRQRVFNFFWKIFVWFDYTIRHKRFPKSIELTNRIDVVKINKHLCGFYSKEFFHHENCGNAYGED